MNTEANPEAGQPSLAPGAAYPTDRADAERTANRRRGPSWLPRALFESALIVFSVLLALILNEWRAESAERARVAEALSAVRVEIEENQRLVGASLEYHQRLVEAFTAAASAGAETPDPDVVTYGLLYPARVLRTAWESAQTVGLSTQVSYETVLDLSATYARQDEYAALSAALNQALYEQVLSVGFESLLGQYQNFIRIQKDFAGREQFLLDSYERALNELTVP